MFQTCLFCDSSHVFITFFQIWIPFWTPFWTICCNYFKLDFQAQKIQKVGMPVAPGPNLTRTHHRRGGNQDAPGDTQEAARAPEEH